MKFFLSLVVIAFIPAMGSAQTPRADSISQILEKVDSGAALRVRTQRQTVRGTLTGIGTDALVLGVSSGAQRPIRFDAIDEAAVARQREWLRLDPEYRAARRTLERDDG